MSCPEDQKKFYLPSRPRRMRAMEPLRALVRETSVSMNDLIYPIFVEEEIDDPQPVASMPGVARIPEKHLAREIKAIQADGVKAVMMFGVSHRKDATGSDSWNPDGLLARMVKRAKDAAPDLVVMADVCFCEYTDHGHCGVVENGQVANDATLANLARQAVTAAGAGADVVAPSAMMDGQVRAIREALDEAGFTETPIMAYSSKFASGFYGPFRAAAGCELKGDRKAYQMDPMNGREAIRESLLDEAEGADILMVKPGLPYLDVLARLRERTLLPIAVYQVSGEYAMIKFAAEAGALDEKRVVAETLGAFKRAGADLILTYFARDVAKNGLSGI
ncbi:MAG: porphobilinogen synthase [Alphaproteobacteria bacterium]|nr:porphobilinogen synthase [Alphaproteobacteria bacterium]